MREDLKFVYVLTSKETDTYLEQAYVSMYSLKQQMPEAFISLVTDDITSDTFVGTRKEELKFVDELVSVKLDAKYNAKQRSRLLKTSLRNMINGDYLFLDTDTIICQPLYDVLNYEADIAICYEFHCEDFQNGSAFNYVSKKFIDLQWDIKQVNHYYNSGVMFVRDNEVTRNFYKLWYRNLLYSFTKGQFVDQPALIKTDLQLGNIIKPLDGHWNSQIMQGLQYFGGAYVIHYFIESIKKPGDPILFILQDLNLLACIKKDAVIPDIIKETVKDPYKGLNCKIKTLFGTDLEFSYTNVYGTFRRRYGKPSFNVINTLLIKYSNLKKLLLHKLLTSVKGGG